MRGASNCSGPSNTSRTIRPINKPTHTGKRKGALLGAIPVSRSGTEFFLKPKKSGSAFGEPDERTGGLRHARARDLFGGWSTRLEREGVGATTSSPSTGSLVVAAARQHLSSHSSRSRPSRTFWAQLFVSSRGGLRRRSQEVFRVRRTARPRRPVGGRSSSGARWATGTASARARWRSTETTCHRPPGRRGRGRRGSMAARTASPPRALPGPRASDQCREP